MLSKRFTLCLLVFIMVSLASPLLAAAADEAVAPPAAPAAAPVALGCGQRCPSVASTKWISPALEDPRAQIEADTAVQGQLRPVLGPVTRR